MTFSSQTPSICIVNGAKVSGIAVGTCTIAADQVGNSVFSAAATVTKDIVVVIAPPAATPTFSVAAGTYTATQSVKISDTTSGATIYYTTDGSTPTASSTKYTGAISVSSSETVSAVAIANNYAVSNVASVTYTINIPMSPSAAAGTWSFSNGATYVISNVGGSGTPFPGELLYGGTVAARNGSAAVTQYAAVIYATGTAALAFPAGSVTFQFGNGSTSYATMVLYSCTLTSTTAATCDNPYGVTATKK